MSLFPELVQRKETRHFKYYCSQEDSICLDRISNALESNYHRILNDLSMTLNEKVEIKIYPSIKIFHKEVLGAADFPEWLVGTAKSGMISVVSPLNSGPAHDYESILKTVVHEFIHVLVKRINPGRIHRYLNEGIALFEAEQMDKRKRDMVADVLLNENIPTIDELESDFVNRGGYYLAYTIVEYIVAHYGFGKLVGLVRNPLAFQRVFGITKEEFERSWVEFLEKHYSTTRR